MDRAYRDGSKFMLFLILFIILVAGFVLPAVFVAMGLGQEDVDRLRTSPWFMIASQLVFILAPLLLWVYFRRGSFKDFMKNEPLGFANVALVVGISFFVQPAMMFVSGLTGLFFPNEIADVVLGFMEYPFWLVLLAVAVTPAIVEEVVFRGYVQSRYEGFGIGKAAIISGLFFGIIHMNMQQFFYAFILGVLFSYIVFYTRSIVAGILAHFIINASQVTLLRLVMLLEGMLEEAPAAEYALDVPEITPLMAVIVIGVFALFTSPVVFLLMRELVARGKRAIAAKALEAPQDESPQENVLPESPPKRNPFTDPFLLAVVAVFLAFMVVS